MGQVLTTNAEFAKDSLKLGEPIDYSLSIRYPKSIDVVFPDSLYSYAPFEFLDKISFPTRSDSLFSFDSAVYTLTTFEIDSIQILELPIFLVTDGDSVPIQPGADSIILVHLVESIPDSISMIDNTSYANVDLKFNYPFLVVGVTVFTITALVIFMVFGKTIRKKIRLYRIRRMHIRFLERFQSAIRDLTPEEDYRTLEHLLTDWKGYMEKLNKTPYTKLTSREINLINPDKELNESLKNIDRAIYGGLQSEKISGDFDYLRRISEDSYHSRVEEIKNG